MIVIRNGNHVFCINLTETHQSLINSSLHIWLSHNLISAYILVSNNSTKQSWAIDINPTAWNIILQDYAIY